MVLYLGMRFCSYKRLSIFLHLLWSEMKLFFVDGLTTLEHFTNWVRSSR